jgi:hypothetical protein
LELLQYHIGGLFEKRERRAKLVTACQGKHCLRRLHEELELVVGRYAGQPVGQRDCRSPAVQWP